MIFKGTPIMAADYGNLNVILKRMEPTGSGSSQSAHLSGTSNAGKHTVTGKILPPEGNLTQGL